jgi:hypothetical protein
MEEELRDAHGDALLEPDDQDDSDSDDDDMMNMEIPLMVPVAVKQQKPSTDFTWNKDAIVECLQLSLEAHDSNDSGVPEWRPPTTVEWKPQPVPLPEWAKLKT